MVIKCQFAIYSVLIVIYPPLLKNNVPKFLGQVSKCMASSFDATHLKQATLSKIYK